MPEDTPPVSASSPGKLARSASAPPRDELAQSVVWHSMSVSDVRQRLEADTTRGLSEVEAAKRLKADGPNVLATTRGRSVFSIFIHQFKSLMVLLLLAATAVSFVLGEHVEAGAILIVIVLNAGIGFFIEWKAERTLSALHTQSVQTAHVLRDGAERQIDGAELVAGDLVSVAAGVRVPADGRVVESVRLQIEEAALTGESQAVVKVSDAVDDQNASLGDRIDMVYMGTAVTDGHGLYLITATGNRTEMGKIGKLIAEAVTRATPLERKLSRLSTWLIGIVFLLTFIIVLAGWWRGGEFLQMLEVGISLAIAAVPEGLAAVTTMTLALGMQRMAKQGAIMRRLAAVETLGSTTVICTDKTGTLTKNEMTVRAFILGQRRITVTGSGYALEGEFQIDGKTIDARSDEALALALRIGALCNDAKLEHAKGKEGVLGDPTEGALIVAAEKAGFKQEAWRSEYERVRELPFDSEKKRMVTVHRLADGHHVAYVKGSPGNLIEACRLTPEERKQFLELNLELASKAMRVLALAYRELPANYDEAMLDQDLTYVGLVGMEDPLREEAQAAIATCLQAGIRTIMITGDQPATASEIARQLGIDQDAGGQARKAVHGRDLTGLDAAGWQHIAANAGVFARVSPEQKLQIVEALQRAGEIVAMTGDGVNDAPALKQADIGIAMGQKGTEVAKETSSMIITDDNFTTIVGAVEQGRVIYANIVKFIYYLFSCNTAEILTVFVAIMIGWPVPLVALQILWLNMVTDVFPALALAVEPSAPDMMKEAPRDPRAPVVSLSMAGLIVWQGAVLAVFTLIAFAIGMRWHGAQGAGLRVAMTMSFTTLALVQVFHAFNARSQTRSAFGSGLFANGWLWGAVLGCILLQLAAIYIPLLQRVLHTTPLATADWAVIVACSLAPVAISELVKLVRRAVLPSDKRTSGAPANASPKVTPVSST